jgi:hypothetical protein
VHAAGGLQWKLFQIKVQIVACALGALGMLHHAAHTRSDGGRSTSHFGLALSWMRSGERCV